MVLNRPEEADDPREVVCIATVAVPVTVWLLDGLIADQTAGVPKAAWRGKTLTTQKSLLP